MNADDFLDDFIDSNIFVYMFDESAPDKRRRANALVRQSLTDKNGCISFQVVQETLNAVIRKFEITREQVQQLLEGTLIPLWQIYPSPALYLSALDLRERYGFSFYDSLIVAAALEAGCTRLYSEDMQHGQQIHQLTIYNPFVDESQSAPLS